MKINKIMLISIVLLTLLSFSAVSAENATDIVALDENSELNDDNLEASSMDEEIIQDTDNTVTPDNFFDYFDNDGYSKTTENITFQGEFDQLVDRISITSPVTINGENATFKNMGIEILDNVQINGLTLIADQSLGDLIHIYSNGVILSGLDINYNTGEESGKVIFIEDSSNVNVINSKITFESHIANDEDFEALGINIVDGEDILIDSNVIFADYPILKISSFEELGSNKLNTIRAKNVNRLKLTNNRITTNSNEFSEDLATLQSMLLSGVTNSLVAYNNISVIDLICFQGDQCCLYGCNFALSSNLTFYQNNIDVFTEGGDVSAGTAYPIQGATSDVIIIDNNFTAKSNGPMIGIYVASTSGEESTLEIRDNYINVTGFADSSDKWALVSGIEIQNGEAKIYNNTIYTYNVNDYGDKNYIFGVSYAQWMHGNRSFDIRDNLIVTEGKYAISTIATQNGESTPLTVIGNKLQAHDLTGDDAIFTNGEGSISISNNTYVYEGTKPIEDNSTGANSTEDNITVSDMTITINSVWIGMDNTVKVTVINGTGTVSIRFKTNTYTPELVNGVATQVLPAGILTPGINTLTVTYGKITETATFNVLNGIVDKNNVLDYFNQSDNGRLYDYIPEGATLDFRGEISSKEIGINNIYINKAMNLISSTQDATIDLNTVAVGMEGENVGNRFTIDKNGSKTNVSDITFHNTQVWLYNTDHVTLDNISVIVLNQKIGSGVGVTSIRQNSTYITVKNSYFSTTNNGGHSSLVLSWADHCTVENNIIVAEGQVGNLFYLNTYNTDIPKDLIVNSFNVIRNNTIRGPSHSSTICRAMAYGGTDNLIENNTIYYSGEGIYSADNAERLSNIIVRNNHLYDGASMSILKGVSVYNNYVTGKVTLAAEAVIHNNTIGGLNIKGDNASAISNEINGAVTIDGVLNAQIKNSNISGDISIARNGENIIISKNTIQGTITVKGINNIITDNHITSNNAYAIVLTDSKASDNNVTFNRIYAKEKLGDEAVNSNGKNKVENNMPISSGLLVKVDDIKVGENAIIDIWINEDAVGIVKVLLNNVEHEVTMNRGHGQLIIPDLASGTYTAEVEFKYDNDTEVQKKTDTFEVSKYPTSIRGNVTVEVIDNQPVFTIELSEDHTGQFTVKINDKTYSKELTNGKAIIEVNDISAGRHSAVLNYTGDDKYEADAIKLYFTVKADSIVNAMVENITVKETAVFIIACLENATGNVSIIIDNNEYSSSLANGTASINVSDLASGNYTIIVKYLGDENYLPSENTTILTVNRIVIDNDIISVVESDVIIDLPADASGFLTVNNRSGNVVDGSAKVSLDLTPGEYDFTAVYSGDSIYASISKEIHLSISKYSSTVSASFDDIMVEDTAVFNITVPDDATGNVSIIINNTYNNATLINGKATVKVSNLSYGNYNVVIKYYGDDKYFASENTAKINVQRYAVAADAITVDGLTVSITLPNDAKGNLTINTISKSIVDGKANITLALTPGEYEFVAVYSGDGKYENLSKTITFTIPKYDSPIEASAENIFAGDVAIFDVKLPEGATGTVTVIIDSTEYNRTLNNGRASIEVSGLSANEYDAVVKYSGDHNYSSNNTALTLTVSKINLADDCIDLTISHATINLSSDAKGEFEVIVDNSSYKTQQLVDGIAQISIEGLSYGGHIIKAIYHGDEKYVQVSKNITVNVPKPHVPVIGLKGNDVVMLYTSGSSYTVRLTSDGAGLGKKTIIITVNGIKNNVVTDNNGYASIKISLPPKNTKYTVTAEYNGVKTSNTVKVNGVISAKNLKVKKSAKSLKIKVTLKKVNGKYLKSKKVTLKLNGKKFNAKTNNKGVATFKITKKVIKKLKAGKKYTYQVIYLKETVKKTLTVKK